MKRKVNGFKFKMDRIEHILTVSKYSNNRTAILVTINSGIERGTPYGVLTVNLPEVDIPNDTFFIKDYSENEELVKVLSKENLFKPTGMVASSGFVEIPLYQLVNNVSLK